MMHTRFIRRFTFATPFRALLAVLVTAGAASAAGDVMLFRGDHVYIVPQAMSDEMITLAGRDAWQHFPRHTRQIDVDDDGVYDYIAIALGAPGGFGAQIRYRVRQAGDGASVRLGRWYWCVIMDESGRKLFERFNP